jgi:hypothetical protein
VFLPPPVGVTRLHHIVNINLHLINIPSVAEHEKVYSAIKPKLTKTMKYFAKQDVIIVLNEDQTQSQSSTSINSSTSNKGFLTV